MDYGAAKHFKSKMSCSKLTFDFY